MRVLGILLLAVAPFASATIVISSSATCTAGSSVTSGDLSCVNAYASGQLTDNIDFGPPFHIDVTAQAQSGLFGPPGFMGGVYASVTIVGNLYTDGSPRMGHAMIQQGVIFEHGSGGGAGGLVTLNGIAFGTHPSLQTVDFQLGVPFTISVSAWASTGSFGAGSSDSFMYLSLFEAGGSPVEALSTPEPSTWALLALGLLSIVVVRSRAARMERPES